MNYTGTRFETLFKDGWYQLQQSAAFVSDKLNGSFGRVEPYSNAGALDS